MKKNYSTFINYWNILLCSKKYFNFFKFFIKRGNGPKVSKIFFNTLIYLKENTGCRPLFVLQTALYNFRHFLRFEIKKFGQKKNHGVVYLPNNQRLKYALTFLYSKIFGKRKKYNYEGIKFPSLIGNFLLSMFYNVNNFTKKYLEYYHKNYQSIKTNTRYFFLKFKKKKKYFKRNKKNKFKKYFKKFNLFKKSEFLWLKAKGERKRKRKNLRKASFWKFFRGRISIALFYKIFRKKYMKKYKNIIKMKKKTSKLSKPLFTLYSTMKKQMLFFLKKKYEKLSENQKRIKLFLSTFYLFWNEFKMKHLKTNTSKKNLTIEFEKMVKNVLLKVDMEKSSFLESLKSMAKNCNKLTLSFFVDSAYIRYIFLYKRITTKKFLFLNYFLVIFNNLLDFEKRYYGRGRKYTYVSDIKLGRISRENFMCTPQTKIEINHIDSLYKYNLQSKTSFYKNWLVMKGQM